LRKVRSVHAPTKTIETTKDTVAALTHRGGSGEETTPLPATRS
jgi:hypothetical protein